MSTLTTLNVRIGADISGFQNAMGRVSQSLSSAGQKMQAAGRTMSAALTLPIGAAGAAALKAASDVEEMEAKFNTVFRTVGSSVKRDVDSFASSVGRSRFELRGMTAALGDIFKPLGFTEQQAGDLAVQMTKLAVDLGSFNNMPMDEALLRLQGTLVGSHENALRFGVVINENVLKQELARMGADKLTGAQKEQAKVQARLNLLMAGTTDAQGDALRTSGSFANQSIALRNALKDLGVELGRVILPTATMLVDKLNGVVAAMTALSPEVKRITVLVAGAAAAMGPLMFGLSGVASGFSAILKAVSITMGLFNPYLVAALAIASAGALLYKNWDKVFGVLEALGKEIKGELQPAFDSLKTYIKNWVDDGIDLGLAIWGTLKDWWTDNGDDLLMQIGGALASISAAFTVALDVIIQIIDLGLNNAKAFWAQWGADIVGGVGYTFTQLFVVVQNGMDTFSATMGAVMALTRGDWDTAWAEIKRLGQIQMDTLVTSAENFKTAFLSGSSTEAQEFLDQFQVEGFTEVVGMALAGTETDWKKFRQKAETELDLGAEEMDALFGSEDLRDTIAAALASSATDIEDFKTDALLNIAAGGDALDSEFGSQAFRDKVSGVIGGVPGLFDTMRQNVAGFLSGFKGDVADTMTDAPDSVTVKIGEVKRELEDMLPDTLEMPEGYQEFIDNFVPTEDENTRWDDFVVNMANLNHHLGEAQTDSLNMARDFEDISSALDVLGLPTKFVDGVSDVLRDVSSVFGGLEAISRLLMTQTWIDAWNNLVDVASSLKDVLGDVLGLIAKIVVKVGKWVLAQIGLNQAQGAGGGITIGGPGTGVPPVTVPGAGAGAGAGGGFWSSGSWAGLGATLGVFGNALFGNGGVFNPADRPWEGTGMTESEWRAWYQETYGAGIGRAFTGVDWSSVNLGDLGLNFGSGWLTGTGGFGGATDVSGRISGGQTVNVILDGRTIATATVPHMAQELNVVGANY